MVDPFATVITALILVVQLVWFALLARVLLSWVDPNPYATNAFKRLLFMLTDPILEPLRRVIPPIGMLDISPIVAFVLLRLLEGWLIGLRGGY